MSEYAVSFCLRHRDLPDDARLAILHELGHVHPNSVTIGSSLVRICCDVRAHDPVEAEHYVVDRVASFLRGWYGLELEVLDVAVDGRVRSEATV